MIYSNRKLIETSVVEVTQNAYSVNHPWRFGIADAFALEKSSGILVKTLTDYLFQKNIMISRRTFFIVMLFALAFASIFAHSAGKQGSTKCVSMVNIDSLRNEISKAILDSISSAEDRHISKHIVAMGRAIKPNIYGAFAQQYPLMLKDYVHPDGWTMPVSVKVKNQCYEGKPCHWTTVLLRAWIPEYTDTATVTKAVNPNEEVILSPQFTFNIKALAHLTTPRNAKVELRAYALKSNQEILFDSQSEVTTIHPIDVYHDEDLYIENQHMWYGIWVTPNMDSISAIHKQIGEKFPNGTISDKSIETVKAVYDVLAQKHIRYVDNSHDAGGGQKIKYPIQVLQKRQANCIEGVVLFASILESLEFQPLIVLIPGHAILGWYTNKEKTEMEFLETTAAFQEGVNFESANKEGIKTYKANFESGAFEKGESLIIDVDKIREKGIMPNDI